MIETLELRPEDVANARLYANRVDMLKQLGIPQGGAISEIGVAFGDFSLKMIDFLKPTAFYAYDLFELHHVEEIWGKPSAEVFQGRSHLEYYTGRLEPHKATCDVQIFKGDSSQALATVADEFFDLIYIDGDHEHGGVIRDADTAEKKIKSDGILIFNDYIQFDHIGMTQYGIVPVVNEFCVKRNWEVIGFSFQPQMFCDIAIRRKR